MLFLRLGFHLGRFSRKVDHLKARGILFCPEKDEPIFSPRDAGRGGRRKSFIVISFSPRSLYENLLLRAGQGTGSGLSFLPQGLLRAPFDIAMTFHWRTAS